MQGITQVKRSLKATLIDKLPGYLQRYDLEAADGITTPPPYEIHESDVNALGGYPAIELHGRGSANKVDSVAQVYRHRIVASVTVVGEDEPTVSAQVERYIYAIRKLAADVLLGDPPAEPIEAGQEEYGPVDMIQGLEIPFVKGGFIELFVTTVE